FPPLPPAERVEAMTMTARERDLYTSGLAGHIAGTEEQVAAELESVLKDTGAQEVLVTTSTHDRDALLDSYRRLAAVVGTGDGARRSPRPGARRRPPVTPYGAGCAAGPRRPPPRCAPCAPGRGPSPPRSAPRWSGVPAPPGRPRSPPPAVPRGG